MSTASAPKSGSEGGSPLGQFTIPGLVILLFSTLALLAVRPELKSARPPTGEQRGRPLSSPQVDTRYARLWDDPLAQFDDVRPAPPNFWHSLFSKPDGHRALPLDTFVQPGATNGADPQILFIPVLVPGGPYGEDIETRIRTRYAVVAALIKHRFQPLMTEQLSYVSMPVRTRFHMYPNDEVASVIRLPVELYRRDLGNARLPANRTTPSAIRPYVGAVVCYVDESQLGESPLNVLNQIYVGLFADSQREQVPVSIIGPSNSGLLSVIESERFSDSKKSLPEIHFPAGSSIYSPRATVALASQSNQDLKPDTSDRLKLIRTIGDDVQLVRSLVLELALRRVDFGDRKQHLVLVTERDSTYGQSMHGLFVHECAVDSRQIHEFTYLRGIDGTSPKTASNGGAGPKQSDELTGLDHDLVRGTGQFDYLRRMSRQIEKLADELRRNGEQIGAIGVVGTDFYDKLLVLRALRKSFPKQWFFTTDLDAGFGLGDEVKTTRNLLVVSHFGLSLRRNYQGDVPAFRDSYQTSTFFATLMAIGAIDPAYWNSNPWNHRNTPLSPMPTLEPLVFEIGLHGPYQLTQTGVELENEPVHLVHPSGPRDHRLLGLTLWQRIWVILAGLALFGLVACLVRGIRTVLRLLVKRFETLPAMAGLLSGSGALLALFLAWAIISDHGRAGGEPFSLTEGISVWPSVVLRTLTAVLAIGFLFAQPMRSYENYLEWCRFFRAAPPRPPNVAEVWSETWKSQDPAEITRLGWIFPTSFVEWSPKSIVECHHQYVFLTSARCVMSRVAIFSFVTLVMGICLFLAFGIPNIPSRGALCFWVTGCTWFAGILAMIVVTLFVIDTTKLATYFVRGLARHLDDWPFDSLTPFQSRWTRLRTPQLARWVTIQLIGEHTKAVNRLFWVPCGLIFLTAASRMSWFDHFDFPLSIQVLMLLAFLSAIFCGYQLRREARKVREVILDSLRDTLTQWLGERPESDPSILQLRCMIEQIESDRQGAFSPLSQDPLLLSLGLPFGGTGGLLAIEQLVHWM